MTRRSSSPPPTALSSPVCSFCGVDPAKKHRQRELNLTAQASASQTTSTERTGSLRRCSRCKSRWYCSVRCQRNDWRRKEGGHKEPCRALQAWNELQQIVMNETSPQEAWQAYYQAQEEIEKLQSMERMEKEKKDYPASEYDQTGNDCSSSRPTPWSRSQNNTTPVNGPTSTTAQTTQLNHVKSEAIRLDDSEMRSNQNNQTASWSGAALGIDDTSKSSALPSAHAFAGKKEEINKRKSVQSTVIDNAQSLAFVSAATTAVKPQGKNHPDACLFDFYVEELLHLQSYQVEIYPRRSLTESAMIITLEDWSIRIDMLCRESNKCQSGERTYSSISLQNKLYPNDTLDFILPGKIQSTIDSAMVQDERLSLRLSKLDQTGNNIDTDLLDKAPPLISPDAASRICCPGCHTPLLYENDDDSHDKNDSESKEVSNKTGTPNIQRVCALLSGWWDEMSDYLTCYEGQASVDFSSTATTARPGLVWEDDTVLVYHLDDVAHRVQVLAIPGYGEGQDDQDNNENNIENKAVATSAGLPLLRGGRRWTDAVGGATVVCSCCCFILGVAPVELVDTVRFFKHRMALADQSTRLSSILDFCVHSMVRFAESKAVFSLLVHCEDLPATTGLVLQLVSWDRRAARSFVHNRRRSGDLAWSKVTTVLYEERNDIPMASKSLSVKNWIWSGGGDWCCPPGSMSNFGLVKEEKKSDRSSSAGLPASYVSLHIEAEEWMRLKNELADASKFYSTGKTNATFLAKNGRVLDEGAFGGLAAVFSSFGRE